MKSYKRTCSLVGNRLDLVYFFLLETGRVVIIAFLSGIGSESENDESNYISSLLVKSCEHIVLIPSNHIYSFVNYLFYNKFYSLYFENV